jgi:hypothetical protein
LKTPAYIFVQIPWGFQKAVAYSTSVKLTHNYCFK